MANLSSLAAANSSFDNDGDSLMQSGTSSPKPSTPSAQIRSVAISDLSPPDSQGVPLTNMPSVAPSASGANVNGKRPISSIDPAQDSQRATSLSASIPTNAQIKTHSATGYSWHKPDDEPGHSWKNKKAQDEYSRAWDSLVDKNRRIGSQSTAPDQMLYPALTRCRQVRRSICHG